MTGFLWRLVRLLRRERPDVAHGLLAMPSMLLTLVGPFGGQPRVVWGVAASNMDLSYYDWFSRLEFRLSILLSRCADLVVSNSQAGLAYHESRGYPPGRTMVIPNGVDLERFRPDPAARRRLRAEWAVSPEQPLIGLVGRLDPMKDHRNFLHAAGEVAAVRRDARFVCVGDGPPDYRAELRKISDGLGLGERLVWAGTRDDIGAVYNALDLNVCASMSEGLPNTVVEAMATGVPSVVTDVGDSAAVVADLGWICPPRDSRALAAALLQGLDALPCDSARIRNRIRSHYGADARADRFAHALSRLIDRRATRLARSP